MSELLNGLELIESIYNDIQSNKTENVMNNMVKLIDCLQQIFQEYAEDSRVNLIEVNKKLSELMETIETGDYFLMGDILCYEIKPVLEVLVQ